jgi:hypothetical protein
VAASAGELVAQLTRKRQTGPVATDRLPADRPVEVKHDHAPDEAGPPGAPKTAAQITAEFSHQHDKADEATFFDSGQKATLRDVLAAMWESEGFLRTIRPAEALPAENRALELLKELQQSDRAYVQRVGFEPAPINFAERRLRGELGSIPAVATAPAVSPPVDADLAAVRAALGAVAWARAGPGFTREELAALRPAEGPLTRAATRMPEKFLDALQALRLALADDAVPAGARDTIARSLAQLLPAAEALPDRPHESSPALAEPYFKALNPETAP